METWQLIIFIIDLFILGLDIYILYKIFGE